MKHDVGDLQKELLNQKVAEMEDRSRRSILRLVSLPESAEGENTIQFLQDDLLMWIPSLSQGEDWNSTDPSYIQHPGQNQPSTDTHLLATSLSGQGQNSQWSQSPLIHAYTPDIQWWAEINIQAAVFSWLQQRYRAEDGGDLRMRRYLWPGSTGVLAQHPVNTARVSFPTIPDDKAPLVDTLPALIWPRQRIT